MNFKKILEFLRELFLTDSGKLDILTLICALVVAVYGIALLLMPFAVFRLRRETIKLRKLQQTLVQKDKHTRDAIRDLTDALARYISNEHPAKKPPALNIGQSKTADEASDETNTHQ